MKQKGGKVVTAWAVEGTSTPLSCAATSSSWNGRRSRAAATLPEVDRAQWYDFAEAREKMNSAQHAFVPRLEEVLRERGRID